MPRTRINGNTNSTVKPILSNMNAINARTFPTIIQEGRDLVRNGKIVAVSMQSQQLIRYYTETMVYAFTVFFHDVDEHELLKTEITIEHGYRTEPGDDFQCDCNRRGYFFCKHAYAAYLWIYQMKVVAAPSFTWCAPHYEDIESRYYMAGYRDNALKLQQLFVDGGFTIDFKKYLPVHLQPTLKNNEIRFKGGVEKLYLIKNIKTFLDAVDGQTNYTFGKTTVTLNPERFEDHDKDMLDLLRQYVAKQSEDERPYYTGIKIDDNGALLYNRLKDTADYGLIKDIIRYHENAMIMIEPVDSSVVKLYMGLWDVPNTDQIKQRYGSTSGDYIQLNTLYHNDKLIVDLMPTTRNVNQLLCQLIQNGAIRLPRDMMESTVASLLRNSNNQLTIEYVGFDEDVMDLPYEYGKECICKLYIDLNDEGQVFIEEFNTIDGEVFPNGFMDEEHGFTNRTLINNTLLQLPHTFDPLTDAMLLDPSEGNVIDFLRYGIRAIQEYGEVYVSEAIKRLMNPTNFQVSLGVRFSNGLLEMDLSNPGIDPGEWSSILRSYRRKRRFIKLKNGQVIDLQQNGQLEAAMELMDDLNVDIDDISTKGKVSVAANRLATLNADLDRLGLMSVSRDETFQKQLDQFKNSSNYNVKIPKKYNALFRDYQKNGYQWLMFMIHCGFNPILADDMGLGKTIQVLAVLETMKSHGPSIVVSPATLVYNWNDEITKFNCDLKVGVVVGPKENRRDIYAHYKDYDLLLTSYDYIRRDTELIEGIQFNLAILDEAQYIKNALTKNAQSVKAIQADHRLALTGTPIENSLAELWSIFDFLMPGYLYGYKFFKRQFEEPIVHYQDEEKIERLQQMVKPFILRRVKKDVLDELPSKEEQIRKIDFNEKESQMYHAQLVAANAELANIDLNSGQSKMKVLTMLLRLRQMCCDLKLMYEGIEFDSSKSIAAMDIIENVKADGGKVLLFSSFTSMLDILADMAKKRGISFYKLTGSDTKESRRQMVDAFQHDDTTLFLISLKAGGTGLNLTAANTVIHFDPWWNQSATNQATDRAYRIGQTSDVTVIKLVVRNTIEERIIELQNKKQVLSDLFVQTNAVGLNQFSNEEILALFQD